MLFNHPSYSRRLATGLVLLTSSVLVLGCGGPTANVTGIVKYKGEPLPSGSITFYGPDGNSVASAPIKEDGSYSLEAPLGECTITITVVGSDGKGDPSGTGPIMTGDVSKLKDAKTAKEGPSKYDNQKDAKMNELDKKIGTGGNPTKPRRVVPIPRKYADPKTSGLNYLVKRGSKPHDIELTDQPQ